jgi:hypothetical protein
VDRSWRSHINAADAADAGLCLRLDDTVTPLRPRRHPVAPPWPWWMQLLPRYSRGAEPCYSVPRSGARSRLRPDLRLRTPTGDKGRRADGGGGGGGRALTRARARSAAAGARRQSTSATGSIIVAARSPKVVAESTPVAAVCPCQSSSMWWGQGREGGREAALAWRSWRGSGRLGGAVQRRRRAAAAQGAEGGGGSGWFARSGGIPQDCATGDWELQNAEPDAQNAGAATV